MGKQREMPGGLDVFGSIKITNEGIQKAEQPQQTAPVKEVSAPNLGWLFYRDYYVTANRTSIFADVRDKDKRDGHFESKNKRITSAKWTAYRDLVDRAEKPGDIKLTVGYPGFIAGTGNDHETGSKGEYKIGMTFDHTTGLPYLPGSSVKGVLRSVFPMRLAKMAREEKNAVLEKKFETLKNSREAYIREILKGISPELADIDPEILELEIFEGKKDGKTAPMPLHDVFFDAWPVGGAEKLLDEDSITPHLDKDRNPAPLKDPVPILFLKVSPGVQFMFRFKLQDGLITSGQKSLLFQQILKDMGAGAMTRKNYGNLT